jgi:adenosylhomocysteinase
VEVTGVLVTFSTQDQAAAAIAAAGIQVYAWKGLNEEDSTGVLSKHYSCEDRKPLNMILMTVRLTNMVIDRYLELVAESKDYLKKL